MGFITASEDVSGESSAEDERVGEHVVWPTRKSMRSVEECDAATTKVHRIC